jgi:hypothetical protein
MSNTISAEEYRRMMIDKKHGVPKHRNPPPPPEPRKKAEPKTGKLDTVAALKAMGNYFELDAKSVNFFINQLRINGKL